MVSKDSQIPSTRTRVFARIRRDGRKQDAYDMISVPNRRTGGRGPLPFLHHLLTRAIIPLAYFPGGGIDRSYSGDVVKGGPRCLATWEGKLWLLALSVLITGFVMPINSL